MLNSSQTQVRIFSTAWRANIWEILAMFVLQLSLLSKSRSTINYLASPHRSLWLIWCKSAAWAVDPYNISGYVKKEAVSTSWAKLSCVPICSWKRQVTGCCHEAVGCRAGRQLSLPPLPVHHKASCRTSALPPVWLQSHVTGGRCPPGQGELCGWAALKTQIFPLSPVSSGWWQGDTQWKGVGVVHASVCFQHVERSRTPLPGMFGTTDFLFIYFFFSSLKKWKRHWNVLCQLCLNCLYLAFNAGERFQISTDFWILQWIRVHHFSFWNYLKTISSMVLSHFESPKCFVDGAESPAQNFPYRLIWEREKHITLKTQ